MKRRIIVIRRLGRLDRHRARIRRRPIPVAMATIAEVLSEGHWAMLPVIRAKWPKSLTDLADLTGRQV